MDPALTRLETIPTATSTSAGPPARWVAPPQARLFLGVTIPPATRHIFQQALQQFPQYIEKTLPESRWHLTLAFLGDVENPQQYLARLLKPLPQTYVPTVSAMHIGRGLQRVQLWSYVHPSTSLLNLRTQLINRLRTMRFPLPKTGDDFVPHVHLANLYPMARGIGIADYPCAARFALRHIHLYESLSLATGATYVIRGSIALNP